MYLDTGKLTGSACRGASCPGIGIDLPHLLPGLLDGEHPPDSFSALVPGAFPCGDFSDELVLAADSTVEVLALENADLDFDHVQPTGVLWRVVGLEETYEPPCLLRLECLVERRGRVRRVPPVRVLDEVLAAG